MLRSTSHGYGPRFVTILPQRSPNPFELTVLAHAPGIVLSGCDKTSALFCGWLFSSS